MKTIQNLLTEKGFTEGVDYSYSNDTLTILPQTKTTTEIVHHEATAERPAYDEEVTTTETWYADVPTLESIKSELVGEYDVAILVNEYLKDKKALLDEEDCINISEGNIVGWSFKNIPAPTMAQLFALRTTHAQADLKEKTLKEKLEKGKKAREVCESVLDLIAGYNYDRKLTAAQITEMQTTFGDIEKALKASRPTSAKALITAIVVDDVLVSQDMKDDCLSLLSEY